MTRAVRHALGALAGLFCLVSAPAYASDDLVENGAYLVKAAGCVGCHTAKRGTPFAGGLGLKTPFGTFFSPNITPHPELGIGSWSDEDFVRALHEGVRPDGARYFPVFPYPSYTRMTREDALAIKAYLFSLAPVEQPNREHDVSFPFSWRLMQRGWRMMNFDEGRFQPDPAQSDKVNRGGYLVKALAHCGECHTPRNIMGGLDNDMFLAGTPDGPEDQLVPNITPHATGAADWSERDLVQVMRDGMKPDFDNVQGTMAEAIEDGLKYLTDADLEAIAAYLKTVPPIDNVVKSNR